MANQGPHGQSRPSWPIKALMDGQSSMRRWGEKKGGKKQNGCNRGSVLVYVLSGGLTTGVSRSLMASPAYKHVA